jgi:hypothetical protein
LPSPAPLAAARRAVWQDIQAQLQGSSSADEWLGANKLLLGTATRPSHDAVEPHCPQPNFPLKQGPAMTTLSIRIGPLLVCSALTLAGPATATATIGGVVSLVGGSGSCNVSALVPLDTAQDNFLLSRATGCVGTSADVQLRGSAATASVGVRAASSGNGLGNSQVAAQVHLTDQWQISVPVATPLGSLTLPVSLHVEGSISPGALYHPNGGSFLAYAMNIGVPYQISTLVVNGNVSTTGAFAQTFNGTVTWQYSGQPLRAAIGLDLFMPGLLEGVLDFYNSAAASIQLPAGYSATTSSGLPLVFAPVPEPSPTALLAAGLVFVLLTPRLRAKASGLRKAQA